jgi:hypothetical protein
MALTPEGTPYVESTDLVANYPAASLSLANRVDLVGVLPFATSAARATAIPSPTDGQYSYLQDSNSTEFWNGSAWVAAGASPGMELITPTSIANSGGSASASGGAITFTTVNSISLNGVFTSSYQNYCVILTAESSAGNNTNCRLRVGGVDASGSNYDFQFLSVYSSTSTASLSANQDNMRVCWNTLTDGIIVEQIISRPQLAERTRFIAYGGGGTELNVVAGDHDLTTAYDGITYLPQAGNTLTGVVRVYGYKN